MKKRGKMGTVLFSSAPEDSGGKRDDRFEKVEDGMDRDTKKPKGQRQEPDNGIQDERQQGQRPTDDQED
jgi:hypothetical protein